MMNDDATDDEAYLKHKVSKKVRNDAQSHQSLKLSSQLSAEKLMSKLSSQLAKVQVSTFFSHPI
jgi:hypothetical protein